MSGIFLIGVTVLWVAVVLWASAFLIRKFAKRRWNVLLAIIMFLVLMPLPLIDEIVGGRQFENLCNEHSTIQMDRAKATGRTVYLAEAPHIEIKDLWVPIRMDQWRFVDATTSEVVVGYDELHAKGGILIRTLGISEGNVPMIFRRFCAPGGQVNYFELFKELEITYVERPRIDRGIVK